MNEIYLNYLTGYECRCGIRFGTDYPSFPACPRCGRTPRPESITVGGNEIPVIGYLDARARPAEMYAAWLSRQGGAR